MLSQDDYPAPDTVFTYEATLTQPDGTPFTGEIDIENTEHQDDQLSFTNGKASFRLSSTQSIRLKNVPLYSSLQIEETPVPGFTCSVHTIHGSQTEESDSNSSEALEFIPGTRASIHFVNTYSLSPLTLTPDQSYLRGEKVLTGRNWQNGDSFTFEVRALSPANAPLPQKRMRSFRNRTLRERLTLDRLRLIVPVNTFTRSMKKNRKNLFPASQIP
ncbi:hypothetical protein [Allobaculum sp. Allo2]|uniref:DUF7601 domain-containing protein n=1 Tax=Allobaculum sp. Allo2 TaxID=2853432 RepID=UPI001F625C83|nr:hypothetical protein [Allobaculum sp. Allo2]UNT92377.1 hypothetical protein KWG61_09300 [Allobaculum sp. Allo2]